MREHMSDVRTWYVHEHMREHMRDIRTWYVHEHMREHMRDVRTLDSTTGTEVAVTLWDAEGVR